MWIDWSEVAHYLLLLAVVLPVVLILFMGEGR